MTTVSIPSHEAPAERPVEQTAPTNQAPAQEARPEWLPEKFQTPEELAKAYKELETKLGQYGRKGEHAPSQPEAQEVQTPQNTLPPANTVTEEQLGQLMQERGLDLNAYYTEYLQTGTLSENSLKTLESKGISRKFVADYIAGQEALADNYRNEFYGITGGEENFRAMAAWAKAALPPKDIEAFNSVIETGSLEAVKLAIGGMYARYVAANGQEPKLVGGDPGESAVGFRSHHEMVQAMRDPRYRKDPAYRADVERRVAATTAF